MKRVYLDNAATTPMDPAVFETMLPYLRDNFGNPSSIHGYGREARAAVEKARKTIADLINASTGEIFFTSGATEANNMILTGAVRDLGVKHIITSPIEHHAVLHTIEFLARHHDFKLDFVNHLENGDVDYNHLEQLLASASQPVLVSLMHANNEIGNVLDLETVSKLCKQYGALFHSDMVQSVGHFPVDLQAVSIDFTCGSAHKFHGPKGVGFAYINASRRLFPLIHGGGQERNMRAGTENVPGIIGMAEALSIACAQMEKDHQYISKLKYTLLEKLRNAIPGIEVNGDESPRSLYTVLNVAFPPSGMDGMITFNLDIEGIAVSSGSACSSGASTGSHVIQALYPERVERAVRFSFSRFNTLDEIDRVVETVSTMFNTLAV